MGRKKESYGPLPDPEPSIRCQPLKNTTVCYVDGSIIISKSDSAWEREKKQNIIDIEAKLELAKAATNEPIIFSKASSVIHIDEFGRSGNLIELFEPKNGATPDNINKSFRINNDHQLVDFLETTGLAPVIRKKNELK